MKHLAKEYLKRNSWLIPIAEKERGNKDLYSYVWDEYLSGGLKDLKVSKNCDLKKPVRFEVVSTKGGKITHQRSTNSKETALNYSVDMEYKNGNATIYEHTRYKAELRLYNYLLRKINN